MRRISFRRAAVLGVAAAMPFAAQAMTLFQEDFQTWIDPNTNLPALRCSGPGGAGTYTFPPGWFLRNVDNRTPDPQTAYVNEAWEVREDFGQDVLNCIAFSTSFYAPVGAADDWMWTPLIGPLPGPNTRLTWRARAYDPAWPDGYEVRVMTLASGPPTGGSGAIGNQIVNSTVVFSTAAEAAAWTNHEVSLAAYAGQSIYVGFRNNSNDKFLLVIDDVRVEDVADFDPQLVDAIDDPTHEYSKLPAPLGYGFDIEARVRNLGLSALTGVVVEADLLAAGAPAMALTSAPIALAVGETQTVTVGNAVYDQVGTWSLEGSVDSNEGDQNPTNSTLSMDLTEVTANELARAQGPGTGALGIGAGNGGEMGMAIELPVSATLHAVRVAMNNTDAFPDVEPPEAPDGDGVGDFNGYTLSLAVRDWNIGADEPGNLLATGTATVAEDAPIDALTLQFDFEGLILPPGRYLLAMMEPTVPAPRTLALHTMPERYTPATSWVKWPTGPGGGWNEVETFGSQFQRTFGITAILALPVHAPVAQEDAFIVPPQGESTGDVSSNDTRSDDGGNVWTVVTPPASGAFALQPSGAFSYTPAAGAEGSTLTFEYSLCDAQNDCDAATAGLEVLPFRVFSDSFETMP